MKKLLQLVTCVLVTASFSSLNAQDRQVINSSNVSRSHCIDTLDFVDINNTGGVNDFVQIKMCDEIFWIKVTGVDGNDIDGVIDNDLVTTEHGLKCGDYIQTKIQNVRKWIKNLRK